MPDDRWLLYNNLKSAGFNVGDFDTFSQNLNDPNKRIQLYNNLTSTGFRLGSQDDFNNRILGNVDSNKTPQFIDTVNVAAELPAGKVPVSGPLKELSDVLVAPVAGVTREFLNMTSSLFESIFSLSSTAGTPAGVNKVISTVNQSVKRLSQIGQGDIFKNISGPTLPEIPMIPEDDPISKQRRNIEKAIYSFGKARQDWMEKNIVTPEQYKNSFWLNDVPEAFGSMLGFVAGGYLTGAAAGMEPWLMSGFLGALTEAQTQAQQTYDATGDFHKADASYMEGLGIGFTEAADVGIMEGTLSKFAKRSTVKKMMEGLAEKFGTEFEPAVEKGLKGTVNRLIDKQGVQKALTGLSEGLGEFIQESTQTVMENMSDKDLYDSNRDLMQGVAQAGSSAFWSGLLMGMMGHSARHRLGHSENQQMLSDILADHQDFMNKKFDQLKAGTEQVGQFELMLSRGASPQEAFHELSKQLNIKDVEGNDAFLNLQNKISEQTDFDSKLLAHKIGSGAQLTAQEQEIVSTLNGIEQFKGQLKPLYHNVILDRMFNEIPQGEVNHERDQTSVKNPEDNTALEDRTGQAIAQEATVIDRATFGDDIWLQTEKTADTFGKLNLSPKELAIIDLNKLVDYSEVNDRYLNPREIKGKLYYSDESGLIHSQNVKEYLQRIGDQLEEQTGGGTHAFFSFLSYFQTEGSNPNQPGVKMTVGPNGTTMEIDYLAKELSKEESFNLYYNAIKELNKTVGDTPINVPELNYKGTTKSFLEGKAFFQDNNPEATVQKGTYAEVMPRDPLNIQQLSEGLPVRPEMKPILDWLLKEVNPNLRMVQNDNMINPLGQTFGQRGAKGAFAFINGVPTIAINKDAGYNSPTDVSETLIHELWHAKTVRMLSTDRAFRMDTEKLMAQVKEGFQGTKTYLNNQQYFDKILNSPEEFVAEVMSNTSQSLRDWMQNNYVSESKKSWLRHFIDNLLEMAKRLFGDKPTYINALEMVLNQHLQSPIFSRRISGSDIIIPEDNAIDLEVESQDKTMMITEEGLENPRVLLNTAKILADQEGKTPGDYYKFLKEYSREVLVQKLMQSEDWMKKAQWHYERFYKDKFPTLESYVNALGRQLYNYAQSLRKVDKIRITIMSSRQNWSDEHAVTTASISTLGNDYTDKTGRHLTSYVQDIKLFEMLDILKSITGIDFDIKFVEEVQRINTVADKTMDPVYTQISKDKITDQSRNEYYMKMLEEQGYIFPGTWADKDTVIVLKPKGELNQAAIDSLKELYNKRIATLTPEIQRRRHGDESFKAIQERSKQEGRDIHEYLDEDLKEYQGIVRYNSQVIRTLLEDIRFGARVTNQGFQSQLFNPDNKESYDAIRIFKRPYLVAPKSYVDQTGDLEGVLKQLPLKEHGVSIKDGKLQLTAAIFDAKGRDRDGRDIIYNYKGKPVNVSKILVNRYGTERTDGKILYLKGGFDELWRVMHGTLKDGAIKAWIGNSFGGNFDNPFFVKGAYHMVNEDDAIGQWMKDNKITLLISSTAAKVNSYGQSKPFSDSPSTFQIPFEHIQRDKEKGEAKDGGRGLMQTLTTNFITKQNPYFRDKGWQKGLDDIVRYSTRKFNEEMMAMTPAKVLDYLKDQALKGGSDFQKTIGSIVLELAWTNADKNYRKFKMNTDFTEDVTRRQVLNELRRRKVVTSHEIARRIGKFLHDPYFAKGVNDFIAKQLEGVTSFKVPASWAVLAGDLGYLTSSRTDQIHSQARDNYRNYRSEDFINKARSRYKEISNELQNLLNEKETLFAAAQAERDIQKAAQLTGLVQSVDKEINDLTGYLNMYDDNGMPDLNSQEYKDYVNPDSEQAQKEINKFLTGAIDPETGTLNFGYAIISQDIADLYGLKAGDKIVHLAVPSDSMMSAGGSVIAAVMPKELMEPNKIILNSEYIQSMVGKDFDIDTLLVIPKSEAFTDEGFDGIYNTFNDSTEAHKEGMLNLYKKELKGKRFAVPDETGSVPVDENGREVLKRVEDFNFGDTLQKNVRLALTIKYNGESALKRDLFNPLTDSLELLDEYQKDIGKIVNVRKMFTTKTQIGFKSKVGNMVIDSTKTNIPVVYNLFLNMTNDMVDVPTNTNKFHYLYEFLRVQDYINGTNFYDLYNKALALKDQQKAERILNTARAIDSVDKFLFERGIKAGTNRQLDNFNESAELQDNLNYILQQQQINNYIRLGRKDLLEKDFIDWIKQRNKKLDKQVRDQILQDGIEYIHNMSIEDLMKSPALQSVDLVELRNIPSVNMTIQEYVETQTELAVSMFQRPGFEKFKQMLLDTGKKYANLINNIQQGVYKKAGTDNNRLAVQLNLLTRVNPELHYLKAKLITLINPVDQSLVYPESTNMEDTYDKIYQSANKDTYPILIKLMFENTKAFNWAKDRRELSDEVTFNTSIGEIKFSKGPEETLLITYQGRTGNSKQLAESDTPRARKLKDVIYGEMFRSAENRKNLSNLMSLGSTNIPINLRIDAASEMIQKELPNFSKQEQGLFWLSLLGKPSRNINERVTGKSAKSAAPTNLILPYEKDSINSQDRLYHLISTLDDPIAKRFLNIYMSEFNDNYKGQDFRQTYQIQGLQGSPGMFSQSKQDQIWFQEDNPAAQKKWRNEDISWAKGFKTVYSIIRKEKVMEGSSQRTKPVGKTLNFETGQIRNIEVRDVMNALSVYVTRQTRDFGQGAVAFTKVLYDSDSVNEIDVRETTRNNEIGKLFHDIAQENTSLTSKKGSKVSKTDVKKFNLGPDVQLIHKIVETNAMGIDQIWKDGQDYKLKRGDKIYNLTTDEAQFFSDLSIPFKLPAERLNEPRQDHYRIALKYIERYSVDNVNYIQNIVSYLHEVINDLPEGFGRMKELNAVLLKYTQLQKQFAGMGVKYIPHVFEKQVLRRDFERQERKAVEASIRQRIALAKEKVAKGNTNLNEEEKEFSKVTTNQQIEELIQRELNIRFGKISYDNFGDYVHSFQLSRWDAMDNTNYIKDSNVIHDHHQRLFENMLLNDLTFFNMLQYEFRAQREGESQDKINEMKAWFQLVSDHRLIQSKGIEKKKAKPGDRVWFYTTVKGKRGYEEKMVSGIVASNDGKSIRLLMDLKTLKSQIQDEIKYYNEQHDAITQGMSNDNPTERQKTTYWSLYNKDYIKEKPKPSWKMQDYNDRIITGYQNLYNDSDNWGKFDYDKIYGKQYEGTELQPRDAIMIQPGRASTDTAWDMLHLMSAVMYLSGPSAAVTNWLDAHSALAMDFMGFKYFRMRLFGGLNVGEFRSQLRSSMQTGDYAKFTKAFNAVMQKTSIEIENNFNLSEDERIRRGLERSSMSEKIAFAEYMAKEYALKANLHKIERFAELIINEPKNKAQGLPGKAYKGIQKVAGTRTFGMGLFSRAEVGIRISAAFLYSYKAIVEDRLTDPKEIEWAISKGIARTQSLYDLMHRKLKEKTSAGKMGALFSQFTTYQKDMAVGEWDQAKIQGLKFWSAFFKDKGINIDGKTYYSHDTVDPNIYHRWMVKLWMDTIYAAIGHVVPGLRQRSAMGRIITSPLAFLAQAIVTGQSPDEWDLRDWIFSIIGIWFGLGNTLPLQIGANLLNSSLGIRIPVLVDKPRENDQRSPVQKIFPAVPRGGRGIIDLWSAYQTPDTNPNKDNWTDEALYNVQRMEKFWTGTNLIVPTRRQYYTKAQQNVQKAPLYKKPLELIENFPFLPVPLLNMIDFTKGTENTTENNYRNETD